MEFTAYMDCRRQQHTFRQLHELNETLVDVAETRKADPGVFFPWSELAAHGFGLWCDAGPLPDSPAGFDPLVALRLIGYAVADPTAASVAFHRHFRGNAAGELDARDRQILWNLQGKLLRQDVIPPPPPASYRQLKALQPAGS